jgi:hypothetical protein
VTIAAAVLCSALPIALPMALVRMTKRVKPASSGRLQPRAGSGLGLVSLAEQVALAGGTLAHGPDGGADFVLPAAFPWQG